MAEKGAVDPPLGKQRWWQPGSRRWLLLVVSLSFLMLCEFAPALAAENGIRILIARPSAGRGPWSITADKCSGYYWRGYYLVVRDGPQYHATGPGPQGILGLLVFWEPADAR